MGGEFNALGFQGGAVAGRSNLNRMVIVMFQERTPLAAVLMAQAGRSKLDETLSTRKEAFTGRYNKLNDPAQDCCSTGST